jgi:hypothetical protein
MEDQAVSLEEEIEEMIAAKLQADPLALEAILGNREVSPAEAFQLSVRMFRINNDAILRLAQEIDKLSA